MIINVNFKYLADNIGKRKTVVRTPVLRTAEGDYTLFMRENNGITERDLYSTLSEIQIGKIQKTIREDK